jgi:quercetin dioxygenase-like cupin family protein
MKTISLVDVAKAEVEMEGAKDAFKQIPIGSQDGSPNFSFRVFSMKPGGYTPHHSHPSEHVNYIISGEGALIDESGKERLLKAGDFALVLPNEKHQYRNTSDKEDMVMICAVMKEYE